MHSNASIEFWAETRLRDALDNDDLLNEALALLRVSLAAGDNPRAAIRTVLAGFCLAAFGFDLGGDDVRLPAKSRATTDGMVWRAEPPDRPGWWWRGYRATDGTIVGVIVRWLTLELRGETADCYVWAGPIPEPTDGAPSETTR